MMLCPRCQRQGLRDGDGWWCLNDGTYGADRLAAWERLVEDLTPSEWARYRDAARVGEQLQFADVGVDA